MSSRALRAEIPVNVKKRTDTNVRIPLISKVAYGMGDVGCNFSWMFVGNFLMIFYTDVFGILSLIHI